MFNPKKRTYKNNEVVNVKNSYYTFSKHYPGALLEREYESKKDRMKALPLKIISIILIIASAFVGWLLMSVFIDISTQEIKQVESVVDKTQNTVLIDNKLKAFSFPVEKLSDTRYINSFINKMKWNDAEAVVLEFKNSEGKPLYSSNQLLLNGFSVYDNKTLQKALDRFKSKNIAIIASLYCFEDNFASENNPDFAVKYPNSDINWLDGEKGKEGKCWLNPYSEKAQEYLITTIKEIEDFGIDGFILKSVCFPCYGDIKHSYYPGEEENPNKTRLDILKDFCDKVNKSVSGFVALEVEDYQLENDEYNPYYTSDYDLGIDTVININNIPDELYQNAEDKLAVDISYIKNICNRVSKDIIISIHSDNYNSKLYKFLKDDGYSKIILNK